MVIVSPRFSFIQFEGSDEVVSCSHPGGETCLPVYDDEDIAFQFIIRTDTVEEADDLCTLDNNGVSLGITRDGIIDDLVFTEQPDRYRLNSFEILYNWPHGVPGFATVVDVMECFYVFARVGEERFVSNCFKRINEDCYTSVIEYSSDENVFGFAYCGGVAVDESVTCDPEFISFTNQSLLSIPYNASMVAKFGNMPTVTTWILNESNELQNMSVQVVFDSYPVSLISIDLGGLASGVVKIS